MRDPSAAQSLVDQRLAAFQEDARTREAAIARGEVAAPQSVKACYYHATEETDTVVIAFVNRPREITFEQFALSPNRLDAHDGDA